MNARSSAQSALLFLLAVAVAAVRADEPYIGKPFTDKPAEVPGVIVATQYDTADAPKGVTFDYAGNVRAGDIRKDSIGLGHFDKSHVTIDGQPEATTQTYLGWTRSGQWTKYTLHVTEAGTYTIGLHIAAAGNDGVVTISFDTGAAPAITTGPLPIPTTAGHQPGVEVYHVWERLDHLAEIKLPAGNVVMTLTLDKAAGFNVESISLVKK